jgi:hypothetical protein
MIFTCAAASHRNFELPLESIMMNNTEHLHQMGESRHSHGQTPYWKRAHHDWRFWFGLVAMLVAIGIYVGSNDLSRSEWPLTPRQLQVSRWGQDFLAGAGTES